VSKCYSREEATSERKKHNGERCTTVTPSVTRYSRRRDGGGKLKCPPSRISSDGDMFEMESDIMGGSRISSDGRCSHPEHLPSLEMEGW
jgi:hypothetical protein